MPGRLQDKTAIITGAGRGIGAAIARRFVEQGANVCIADINLGTAEATARELVGEGYRAIWTHTDVASRADVQCMVETTVAELGPPDILINNAGVNLFRDPMKLTDEEWRRCFAIDLDSLWYCSQTVLPHMLRQGRGSIVNIASVHAFQIIPGCFPYPVAKHGVIGLTRALAIEYAARNIRVNAICPGYIETQITIDYWNTFEDPDAQRLYAYNIHPPKRIGTADDVAWAAVYLASDEAGFVNGVSLMVDGGRSVLYHD